MTDTIVNIENVYVTSGAEDFNAILDGYVETIEEQYEEIGELETTIQALIQERDGARAVAMEFVEANGRFSDEAKVREQALEGKVQDLLDLNATLRAEIREREQDAREQQEWAKKLVKRGSAAEARVKNLESDLAAYRAGGMLKPNTPYDEDGNPKLGSVWQLTQSHWGDLPPSTWIYIGGRYLSSDWKEEQNDAGDEYAPIEDTCLFRDLHQYLVPHPDFY